MPHTGVVFIMMFSATVTALVPESQRQALVDLHNATGGPNWLNQQNWLDNDPCVDEWFGVQCDGDDNIIGLSLPVNGLNGQIPANITQLSFLETLDISENYLSAVTPEIGQISTLKNLNLAFTYLDVFPNNQLLYFGFSVSFEEASVNTSCPVIHSFDDNFTLSLNMPTDSWIRLRVDSFHFGSPEPGNFPYHVMHLLAPLAEADEDYADNERAIHLHDFVFIHNFEEYHA